jgi:hypothetical protein
MSDHESYPVNSEFWAEILNIERCAVYETEDFS